MDLIKPGISFILELPVTLWFFHQFCFSKNSSLVRRAAGYAALLLLIPLYVFRSDIPFGFFTRIPFRGLVYYLFLYLTRETDRPMRLHVSLSALFLMTTAQMFFGMARVLRIEDVVTFLGGYYWQQALILSAGETVFMFGIHLLFVKMVPIDQYRGISHMQLMAYVVCTLSGIFIRTSLVELYEEGRRPADNLAVFGILLAVSLYACIIMIERYYYLELETLQARQYIQTSEYQVRALKLKEENDRNIHEIYHDLKNHMIALDALLQNYEIEEIHTYLDSLRSKVRWNDPGVHTGNPILNQLLAEKIRQASEFGIPVTVDLDFQMCDFVSNVDMVILFGNALDNAIEAARTVQTGQKFIHVKGHVSAGCFLCVISNSHDRKLSFVNGLPGSTKKDTRYHGYGLSNMRTALLKYGGELNISDQEEHVFSLYLTIPLKQQEWKES